MFAVPAHFCDDVRAAMQIPALPQRVVLLYHEMEKQITAIAPRCEMSGRCCRFEEYGHRLFVTTAEMAAFIHESKSRPAMGRLITKVDGGSCRFQENGMCMAHPIRPMGCRLFFCDQRYEQSLQALYESMHAQLKAIHNELAVPYAYVEWRQALDAVAPLWTP